MKEQKIQATKGMADILPDSAEKHKLPPISLWHLLEKIVREIMHSYNYEEIRFPILENTALFVRSLGEVTDVVEKEMYTFMDGDSSVSLRPEGTASCVRACIENGLIRNQQLQRLWYFGPMFRHEQPQYGRYRQFYQFGVEVFGLPGPDIDAEQIAMLASLWRKLGIGSSTLVEVNSLGSVNAREIFKKDLVEYFSKYKDKLDEDSKKRLHKNPLRILDSKNPELKDLIQGAPALSSYINDEDKQHFDKFLARLTDLKVPYRVNPRLIRGLDYYNRTVYEWVTDKLGAQSAICAGGRYDVLAEQLGGPATPAVGFAMGVERVLLLMKEHGIDARKVVDGYLICAGEAAIESSLCVAEYIREICPQFALAINYGGGSFKSQFKKADKSGAMLALIIGDDELANKTVTIKFLREERVQETILLTELQKFLGGYCGSLSN
jgi:histidyl-tRNA synthetase